jgi:hypothetical protein
MTDDTVDYAAADLKIGELVETLRDADACPCCVARALLNRGADLAAGLVGLRATVEVLEIMADELRMTAVN